MILGYNQMKEFNLEEALAGYPVIIFLISVIDINNVVSVQPYIIINYMGIEKSS